MFQTFLAVVISPVIGVIDLVVRHFHGRQFVLYVSFHKIGEDPKRWQNLLGILIDVIVQLIYPANGVCKQLRSAAERWISEDTDLIC